MKDCENALLTDLHRGKSLHGRHFMAGLQAVAEKTRPPARMDFSERRKLFPDLDSGDGPIRSGYFP